MNIIDICYVYALINLHCTNLIAKVGHLTLLPDAPPLLINCHSVLCHTTIIHSFCIATHTSYTKWCDTVKVLQLAKLRSLYRGFLNPSLCP